jgi:two-component system chemotaxis response regulator CheB
MPAKNQLHPGQRPISVLIVDDSLVFRKELREIFEQSNTVEVIGEALNGIEALDMMLKSNPDVIIMDMEMPLMDGVTSLQHLMIHKPTPTIMFSSLTSEGTARSFDALKYGAVDFVSKDSFFQRQDLGSFQQDIIHRVIYASKVVMRPVEPVAASKSDMPELSKKPTDIIFCEDCGTKNIIEIEQRRELEELRCQNCGDFLHINLINKHKKINFITVIGTGLGGYSNLLRIIPNISPDISGAIVVILYAESSHVDAFSEYLDAVSNISVKRMEDGMNLEGGICYIASARDNVYMKPYSAHYTIRRTKAIPGFGPIDLFMNSITSVFKSRVAGMILSGSELDGVRGIDAIKEQDGVSLVLNSSACLCKEMGENVLRKCMVDIIIDEKDITGIITKMHESDSEEKIVI